jgi:hypothetical protein
MKILLLFLGVAFVAIGWWILKPIVKDLPDMDVAGFLIGGFGMSLVISGLKMLWASFFIR